MPRLPRLDMPGIAQHVIQRGNDRLGNTAEERRQCYRELVMETVAPEETDAIRLHLQRPHIYGPDRLSLAIEARLG